MFSRNKLFIESKITKLYKSVLRILIEPPFYNWTPTDNKTGMYELLTNMDYHNLNHFRCGHVIVSLQSAKRTFHRRHDNAVHSLISYCLIHFGM